MVEYASLKRFISEIEAKFLQPHLGSPTLAPPSRNESLDVAAFVVLAHGAIENFVEGLALWLVSRLEHGLIYRKRISRATAALLLSQEKPSHNYEDKYTAFNDLRDAVQLAKSDVSRRIEQNHGIAPRHLRAIFRPLGVNVTDDPILIGSLDLLVSIRHHWAHQYRYARFPVKVHRSANDVQKTASDCLQVAQKLAKEAAQVRP
jgi:hypothetical protein